MVVIGLVTLALLGILQSVGALVEPLPIETGWYDPADEAKRGQTSGQVPSTPVGVLPATPGLPQRSEPTLDAPDVTTAPVSSARFRSPGSRAPPVLLSRLAI